MLIGGPGFEHERRRKVPVQLRELLSYAQLHVPAYHGLPDVQSIQTIADFQQLSLTTADQLSDHPKSYLADGAGVHRISTTGGTSGRRKVLYRTHGDHLASSEIAARMFVAASVASGDCVAILQPFGIWGIGFIAMEAFRIIGTSVVPVGSESADDQCLQVLFSVRPTVVYATPSRAASIASAVNQIGLGDDGWRPRLFLLAGEPTTAQIRDLISRVFGAEVCSIYGSEETDGLGAECTSHKGIHLVEGGLLYELLQPETLLPVASETGALVVTPIGFRGTVLLRYLTDDMVRIDFGRCPCGSITPRIVDIHRRSAGVYLWDSVFLSENQLRTAVADVCGEGARFQCVLIGRQPPQRLQVLVDSSQPVPPNADLSDQISRALCTLNADLADSVSCGRAFVAARFAAFESFRHNQRGKCPTFVQEEGG